MIYKSVCGTDVVVGVTDAKETGIKSNFKIDIAITLLYVTKKKLDKTCDKTKEAEDGKEVTV